MKECYQICKTFLFQSQKIAKYGGEMAQKKQKWVKKSKKFKKVYQSTTQKLPTPRKSSF